MYIQLGKIRKRYKNISKTTERGSNCRAARTRIRRPVYGKKEIVFVADHFSAVRRNFESRAMPETEYPPAMPVDIYYAFPIQYVNPPMMIDKGIVEIREMKNHFQWNA